MSAKIILTKHALQRIGERKMANDMALQTIINPDKKIEGKKEDTFEFQKQFGSLRVTAVATQNDKKEWIVLSCWIDPPLPGTKDFKAKERYRTYQKAGFWKKMWLNFLSQIGL